MALLANVLWFVLGGWLLFLLYLLGAIVFFPFFLPLARLALYSAWPFGRAVIAQSTLESYRALVGADAEVSGLTRGLRRTSGVLNVLWLLTFGWILALLHIFAAVMNVFFFWLIITLPNIAGHIKLLKVAFMPFNKVILSSSIAKEIDDALVKNRHKLNPMPAAAPLAATATGAVPAASSVEPVAQPQVIAEPSQVVGDESAPEDKVEPRLESLLAAAADSGGGSTEGLQPGSRPEPVIKDTGKTGLIGAVIVLLIAAAIGGGFSYSKHKEDGQLLAAANDQITLLTDQITRFVREKSLMQTTLDALKQRNDRQKELFTAQLVTKEGELQSLRSELDAQQRNAEQVAAANESLRTQLNELEAARSELQSWIAQTYAAMPPLKAESTSDRLEPESAVTLAATSATAGNYAQQIRACVQAGVAFPVPRRNTSANPAALFRVDLTPQGLVRSIRLRESSGNEGFDRSVQRGIQACSQFPLPPGGRYPAYIDISYSMYNGDDAGREPIDPPIPVQNQSYSACEDVGGCVANILTASYPIDRQVLERDVSRLGGLMRFERGDRVAARELNKRGLEAFNRKDYRLAADLFARGVQVDPGDIELRANLGFAFLRARDLDAASEALGNALILSPRRTATWIPVAEYLVLSNSFDLGVRALLVAYIYSRNQQTTYGFYGEKAETEPNNDFRRAYRAAFDVIKSGKYGY